MADVVASGVLSSLLDRLRDRITSEFGQLIDVGAELKKLEGTLSAIRDVLEDAEARQVQDRALRGWLRRLKDVAYDIDDLLDEDFAKNRKRSLTDPDSSTTNWAKGKVSKVLSLPNSVMSQLKIVREIGEIRERLDELAEERSKFHLREKAVVTCCRQQNVVAEETGSFVIESEVFGREEDKKKIVEYLVDASGGDLGIIAIVGMGGVGKTTLAQLVYNDRQISNHFEKRIWVCVSNDFDPKRLVRSIIEYVTGNACDLTSMASMQSKLRQELGERKFLLVLDDVWNENYKEWDHVRTLLVTIGGVGSKVIVTTRSSQVAYLMATAEPHFLKALSEDDCWLLFEKRAFGIGTCERTKKLVTIGKEIVKKCGGIPLAAKALGSLMHSKRRESDWSAIRDNDIWNLEETEILPALRLSYNHLPSHLKQCFTYCSIFPKDIFIETETLIQLWIAEGFIQPFDKSVELADLGMQYLKELLSRSLLEKVDIWSDGTLTNIKIHDLVHDLAQSVSGEECSIVDKDGHRKGVYPMTRYSSFIYAKETIPSILEILDKANKLRTFYFHASQGDILVKTENPQKQKDEENKMLQILQTTFSSMKLLRALHLRYYPIKELPISVSNLRHLRYLDLSSTVLKTLPTSIGFLQNLQILNLQQCSVLETLPTSIGLLFNLQILNLVLCESLKELPESIGDLSNLLTLNLSSCKSLFSLPSSIGNLRSLQHLDLSYSRVQKLPATVCHLSNLRSINLWCCHALHELPVSMKNMTTQLCIIMDGWHDLTTMPLSSLSAHSRSLMDLKIEDRLCISELKIVRKVK